MKWFNTLGISLSMALVLGFGSQMDCACAQGQAEVISTPRPSTQPRPKPALLPAPSNEQEEAEADQPEEATVQEYEETAQQDMEYSPCMVPRRVPRTNHQMWMGYRRYDACGQGMLGRPCETQSCVSTPPCRPAGPLRTLLLRLRSRQCCPRPCGVEACPDPRAMQYNGH